MNVTVGFNLSDDLLDLRHDGLVEDVDLAGRVEGDHTDTILHIQAGMDIASSAACVQESMGWNCGRGGVIRY